MRNELTRQYYAALQERQRNILTGAVYLPIVTLGMMLYASPLLPCEIRKRISEGADALFEARTLGRKLEQGLIGGLQLIDDPVDGPENRERSSNTRAIAVKMPNLDLAEDIPIRGTHTYYSQKQALCASNSEEYDSLKTIITNALNEAYQAKFKTG